MGDLKQSNYKHQYDKENYTRCNLKLRKKEADILTEFSQNLNISKNSLLQKCLVYCYDNMIDVSNIKLTKAEDYNK